MTYFLEGKAIAKGVTPRDVNDAENKGLKAMQRYFELSGVCAMRHITRAAC
jgi:hypothetical protein